MSAAAHAPAIRALYDAVGRLAAELDPTDAGLSPEAVVAGRLHRERQLRTDIFPADQTVFHGTAWDVLLDLFMAQEQGRVSRVTAICQNADVPLTTGLRWIRQLEDMGLIRSWADPRDRRVRQVGLTDAGLQHMTRYLQAIG